MDSDAQLAQYFAGMWPHLDEHARRLVAASQAVELGYGGISRVSRACGLSRVTLTKGVEELQSAPLAAGRIRHEGGGRHALTSNDPGLAPALDGMVEPTARGDPQSPLRWTCKSARTLAAELTARHHPVSHTKVTQLLREDGYSLQGNRKTEEGDDHPDRDAQFRHINRAVKNALRAGEPVISVDTKKKELIGNYQNQGRQWRQTGTADKVNGHDFPGPEVPRAYPYGIYDLGRNAGFVNVGTDHDTGAFAVASIRGWWRAEGRRLYLRARRLLITADGSGSNGWRLAPAQSRILGTVQKQSGDLLTGDATLLDQLQQGIFDFDMQELLQFAGEITLGSAADEGFQGGDQVAPAREPHRLKGPKAMGIKLRDLREGVVAAAMGVAGAIGEFFQLAKHRDVDGGPQGLFQLGQGGDFLRVQELAQTIGEEGGSPHNAIVPPFIGYTSGTIAESGGLRPACFRRIDHRFLWATGDMPISLPQRRTD